MTPLKEANTVKSTSNIKVEFIGKPKSIIVSKVDSMSIFEFISKLSWSVKLNGHCFEKIDSQKVSHKVRTESYSNKISLKLLVTSEDTAGDFRSTHIYTV